MCDEVDEAIEAGAQFIVLSDRDSTKDLAPIPSPADARRACTTT